MKRFLLTRAILGLVALAAANAQSKSSAIPRMPDGKPDFQGVWQHPYVPDMSKDRENQKGAGEPPPGLPAAA